jgi:hypothetical protein
MDRELTTHGMLHTEEELFLPGEMLSTKIKYKEDKAIIVIKQEFWNPTPNPCGVFYFYPMPKDSTNQKATFRIVNLAAPITKEEEDAWRASAKKLPELEKMPNDLFGLPIKALQAKQKIIVELSYEKEIQKEGTHDLLIVLPPLHGPLQMPPSALDEMLPEEQDADMTGHDRQLTTEIFELGQSLAETKKRLATAIEDEHRFLALHEEHLNNQAFDFAIEMLHDDSNLKKEAQRQKLADGLQELYRHQQSETKKLREAARQLNQALQEKKNERLKHRAERNISCALKIAQDALDKTKTRSEEASKAEKAQEELLRGQAKFFEDSAKAWSMKAEAQKEKNEALYKEALQKQQDNELLAQDYQRQYLQQKQKNEAKAPTKTEATQRAAFDFVTRFKDSFPVKE